MLVRPSRRVERLTVLVAGIIYVTIGIVTATLNAPRLLAWVLSGAVFLGHAIVVRPRDRRSVLGAAMHVALGAAAGAFLLALLGPVRSHWGEPNHARLILLSIVAWPLLTGLPAFAVALAVEHFIARMITR